MQDGLPRLFARAVLTFGSIAALWIRLSNRACSFSLGGRYLRPAMLVAALLPLPGFAAEPPPLQMGVLPYLSGERLFEVFLPMKEYLETQLKRRIVLSTAPDFKTCVQRAANTAPGQNISTRRYSLSSGTRTKPSPKSSSGCAMTDTTRTPVPQPRVFP